MPPQTNPISVNAIATLWSLKVSISPLLTFPGSMQILTLPSANSSLAFIPKQLLCNGTITGWSGNFCRNGESANGEKTADRPESV